MQDGKRQTVAYASYRLLYLTTAATYRMSLTLGRSAAVTHGSSDLTFHHAKRQPDNCRSMAMSKLKCLEWKQQIKISFTKKLGAQYKSHTRFLLLSSQVLPALQNGIVLYVSRPEIKPFDNARRTSRYSRMWVLSRGAVFMLARFALST
jgi:hypothetical protein